MSNEDSLHEVKEISYYRNQALRMMNIFNIEEEHFFPMWLNKFDYVANMIEVPRESMGELFIRMLGVDIHARTTSHLIMIGAIKCSYDKVLPSYGYLFLCIPEFQLHRIRFTCREQYVQEPIQKYASNLKKIFNKCKYKMHEEMKLCHQFLKGIRDDDIKSYLKNNPGLSFNDLVMSATAFAKANNITHYLNMAFSMIDIYNPEKKVKFYEWLNKFEYVANMIEVPDDRMVEFFYKMVDNDVHTSVQKTCSSVNFSERSYEELVNYYLRYFSPSYDSDLHRRCFISRIQYKQETIKKYADNLRKIYNKCDYKDRSETKLCEQFVKGIRNKDMRAHLSETGWSSFDKIIEEAIAFLKDNQITYYFHQTLSMMNVFKLQQDKPFFTWLTKFESVTNMMGVPYEIMGELFITMLHDDVHKFIKNNCEIVNCFELSYEQILDKYQYLAFGSEKLKFYRIRFNNRKQYALESIENYAENLNKMFSKCFYKDHLDDRLSKQFIRGLRDEEFRTSLYRLSCMSFAETVKKAIQLKKANVISNYVEPAFTMINMFNSEEEERFYEWFNKFEYVANMIEVPDDSMIEFFDEMVDNDVHKTVKKRFSSVNFFELTYKQLTNYYLRYYTLSYGKDLYKKRFMCRNQYEKETIQKYADNLKKILNKCNFMDKPEEKLSERFINGILDDDIRFYLKKSPGLSYAEIVSKAIEFEKANDITNYIISALSMINVYNPEKEGKFYEWLNKFEFVANFIKVPNNLMVRFFKKMVENDIHMGVKQTFPCVKYYSLSYKEIINLYLRYFSFSCEFHFYRLRFLCRKQYEKETIDQFAESLCDLYDKCIDKCRMEEELCEQFLVGLSDYDMRIHLNKNPHLSFYEMIEEAIAFEKANDISDFLNKALKNINIYDPTKEGAFFDWINKFEYVADMIELPDEKMNKFFDKMVDDRLHTFVKRSNTSIDFSELSYDDKIIHYLLYFSCSDRMDLIRRQIFMARKQYENETIEKFALSLQRLIDKCNYRTSIEERLCERFINGIRKDDLKMRLGKIRHLSFAELVAKVIAFEKGTHFVQNKEE